jgi:threonine dehydratase
MINYNSIQKARENIADFVKPTPLVELNNGTGDPIYLKLENSHERVNAFKIRGAYNKIKSLGGDVGEVVTAAMGSHGFAVGDVCRHLGKKSICFMPKSAEPSKKEKMEKLVDKVIYFGQEFSEAEQEAIRYAHELDLPLIHPYNDEQVIAGQGTIGLELYQDLQDLSTVYVPVGGGGLISGIGIALKEQNPNIRLVGVQEDVMHAMATSINNKRITPINYLKGFAEPLCVNLNPDTITFELVQKYVDDFILVDHTEMRNAIGKMFDKLGDQGLVEFAGIISLAAALKDEKRSGKSVCIISGGNILPAAYDMQISLALHPEFFPGNI